MNEIKVFKEKFEAVQYKIVDIAGNEKIITQATPHTLELQDKIEKIINTNFRYNEDGVKETISNAEKIWEQMIMVFGTDEETKSVNFWKKFQIDFINEILKDFMTTTKKK